MVNRYDSIDANLICGCDRAYAPARVHFELNDRKDVAGSALAAWWLGHLCSDSDPGLGPGSGSGRLQLAHLVACCYSNSKLRPKAPHVRSAALASQPHSRSLDQSETLWTHWHPGPQRRSQEPTPARGKPLQRPGWRQASFCAVVAILTRPPWRPQQLARAQVLRRCGPWQCWRRRAR